MSRSCGQSRLSRRFGAENTLKPRAGKLHSDQSLARTRRGSYVYDAPARGKARVFPFPCLLRGGGDADVQVGAYRQVKPGKECGAAATQIFAGSFLSKDYPAGIAAGNLHRQAYGDAALSSLLREVRARLHRGPTPGATNLPAERCAAQPGSRKNAPLVPALRWESVPREPFAAVRCRSPRHA